MKKTLALLLAILMLCSVALVACQEKEPIETQDPFGDDFGDPADTSGDEDPDATGDEGENSGNNGSSSSYETMTPSTFYVRYPFKVRTKATTSTSESYILGKVNYGDAVEVKGKTSKGDYYVINYVQEDGTKKDGYIYADLLTKQKGMTELKKLTDAEGNEITKEGTVKTTNTNGLNVRIYPWIATTKTNNAFNDGKDLTLKTGLLDKWLVPNGHKVTVIGTTAEADSTHGYWVYFEVTPAAGSNGTTEAAFKGWCPAEYIDYEGSPATAPTTPTPGDDEIKPL